MTIGELVVLLQQCDQNHPVYVGNNDDGYGSRIVVSTDPDMYTSGMDLQCGMAVYISGDGE